MTELANGSVKTAVIADVICKLRYRTSIPPPLEHDAFLNMHLWCLWLSAVPTLPFQSHWIGALHMQVSHTPLINLSFIDSEVLRKIVLDKLGKSNSDSVRWCYQVLIACSDTTKVIPWGDVTRVMVLHWSCHFVYPCLLQALLTEEVPTRSVLSFTDSSWQIGQTSSAGTVSRKVYSEPL